MSSKKRTYHCKECHASFSTYNIGQICCSHKCAAVLRSKNATLNAVCNTCKKSFPVLKSDITEGRGKFCSRECAWNRPKAYSEQAFKDLWDKGFSVHKISTLVTASEETVRRWAKKTGIFEKRNVSANDCHNWKNGIGIYRKKAFSSFEKKCYSCGFDRFPDIIEIHHKDKNRKNNSLKNLIPLCPTCHKCVHRNFLSV